MKKKLMLVSVMMLASIAPLLAGGDAKLKKVIAGDHRDEKNAARDTYRNPYETLKFFGIKDNMTVMEVWSGGGWYTEILAPYLKDNGKLISTSYDRNKETQRPWMVGVNKQFDEKFLSKPELYGKLDPVPLVLPEPGDYVPAGSVDMILDFRNAHNWMRWGGDAMVASWAKALKKGGVVGIVDHRKPDDKEYSERDGYIHEKQLVALMEKHGFKLDARSDINANAKDETVHPSGVWSLPPTLAGGEKDRDKYLAIGESNRLTMRFVKQ